jgi:hypothetical protein
MALLGVVLLGAIGAGLAAAFVANELRPIFQDVDSLREATQRPILGMVTVLPNEASGRRKRRERFLFAGGAGGLAASFAVVFALVFWFGVIA